MKDGGEIMNEAIKLVYMNFLWQHLVAEFLRHQAVKQIKEKASLKLLIRRPKVRDFPLNSAGVV